MFFKTSLDKNYGFRLRAPVNNAPMLRDCHFQFEEKSDYISYTTDRLSSYLEGKIGGGFESSISFVYYRSGELSGECYISRARAKVIQGRLSAALSSIDTSPFFRVDSSEYIPGVCDSAFAFWCRGIDEHNFRNGISSILSAMEKVISYL